MLNRIIQGWVITKKSEFNEATWVQMPALVYLTRIGYE